MTKTIYATPYKRSNKRVTGPSTPTPWHTVKEVFDVLGCEGLVTLGRRSVIYAQGDDAVIYSDIDYSNNNGYSEAS